MPRIRVLATLLAILPLPAAALDPARSVSHYVHDAWQVEHGLPQSSVNAVVQTRDGYVWAGTQEGLARFDGVRFVVFDRANTPAFTHDLVSALHEDASGRLWVGFSGGGGVVLENGAFRRVEGLTSPRLRTIRSGRDGSVWIGTSGGGLNRWKDGRVTALRQADGLPDDRIVALHEDADGTLWIGTFGGLTAWRDGRIVRSWRKADGLPDDQVSSIARDGAGLLWIGTFGGGAARFDGHRFTPVPTMQEVWTILPDRDGNVWIGGNDGLDRWTAGVLRPFRAADGLTSPAVVSLHEDASGALWIGTAGGGLNRLRDGRFVTYTTRDGLASDSVFSVLQSRASDDVWIGTDGGGLSRFRDGAFTTLTTRHGLSSDQVSALAEDRSGGLWVGTMGGGVNVLRDGRVERPVSGLAGEVILALLEDRAGGMWIGTDGAGLHLWRDGRLTRFTSADGLPDDRVSALLQDDDGALWIATGLGLARYANGAFRSWTTSDGLGDSRIGALRRDDDGTLWIATTSGGLTRFANGRFQTIRAAQGLHDDRVFDALDDGLGNLWTSSNRGLSRVAKAGVAAVLDGRAERVWSVPYSTDDGLRSLEGSAELQPTAWRTRDGRLWFATARGVSVVDPRAATKPAPAPVPLVEEILVDGRPLAAHEIPPGSEKLDVHYTALHAASAPRVRFQVQLEGYDRGWIDAGTERTARYTRLPPGAYRFRVRAAEPGLAFAGDGVAVPLHVQPLLHQRPAFRIAVGLLAVAAGFALHRARLRRLQRRARELEALVADQTRDLRAANEQLARLSEGTPQKIENVAAWSAAMAQEVARGVRADAIDVWQADGQGFSALGTPLGAAPSRDDVLAAADLSGSPALVPVYGLTHALRGALVVHGPVAWGDTERRLVTGLAQHLGSALDLQHLRAQLSAAAARQAEARTRMAESGLHPMKLCAACWRCYPDDALRCEADNSPLDASRLLPFRVAERYRLRRLLGEGGMGSVFEAHDEKLDRGVAVKVIRAERLADAGARFRLEREARVMARLHHPAVTSLYDSGELQDGSAYLVMELLEGRDLADVIASHGPGTPQQVASLGRQAGAALAAAHQAGLVHRDVKPANIFLAPGASGELHAKVLDFGLAKQAVEDPGLTQTGVLLGTPAYMTPEQVEGGAVDARTDLYALASVLYEALTTHRVVATSDVGRMLVDVLYVVPPPPSFFLPGLPEEVDALFVAALEKQPERRPADALAWTEALGAALEALPARGPGWPVAELRRSEHRADPALASILSSPTTAV